MMVIIKDKIHENLSLPDYVLEIIETPHFQRLKQLKQLGVSNYRYHEATHSRYEHSIGTAYLCLRLLEILERNSSLKIAEIHKKCVIIGGLLHDIGHGPFSHLWESCVHEGTDKEWTHEDQSVKMIKHMIETHKISLDANPKMHDYALKLISSLIAGDKNSWNELLTPSEMYLTEIVSNKYCNIDVDKCDYLLRDFYYVQCDMEPFVDFINRARVVKGSDGKSHIAYHVDDFILIENMFANRANYHIDVYQAVDVLGVEKQLLDICVLANSAGLSINNLKLTEIQRDCQTYLKLDDTILDLIRESTIDNKLMEAAQDLLQKMDQKQCYTCVYESSDCCKDFLNKLIKKFGNIFCTVIKKVPYANIPKNIPLYDDGGAIVQKVSERQLCYERTLIFSKTFDEKIKTQVDEFISNLNNNNYC